MTSRRRRRRAKRTVWLMHLAAFAAGVLFVWVAVSVRAWIHPERASPARLDPLTTPSNRFDWTEQPAPAFPIPPYARYLEDVRIVLDPGHGGDADRPNWKRGPTGLREADVNLRVAQFLREFLDAVGARVWLTRDADVALDADPAADLAKRIGVANELNADLFLSIHHNGADQPGPNYTSLYFHGSPEQSLASRCAARYLLTGLTDALRLAQDLPCAVLSDQVLYQNGLHVLRAARVPAVLGEASFHSNPQEEQRLRDLLYNRCEAYGYFVGLARWAQAGLPRIELLEPERTATRAARRWVVELDDGLSARGGFGSQTLKIAADSLVVKLNGQRVPFTADLAKRRIAIDVPAKLSGGSAELFVDFENVFGQHVLHPRVRVGRSEAP